MAEDPRMQSAARALARSHRLVVFTGAGVSKESGIPTFREPETGLWARYDPMELATCEAYVRQPEFVWGWYEHRFGATAAASPNPGHLAIVELERLLPRVSVVTQNIDGLHQRAGSSDVVELHGSMLRFKCLSGQHTGFVLDDFVGQDEKPPRCPECGELLRPDVVWFGEPLPGDAIDRAQALSADCDVMLVVGTSGVVYPAAAMPLLAAEAGAIVIDVNPERDALAAAAEIFLQGPGGKVLPELAAAVREHLAG
ncbi:MAG TPA: NAD-dependent deacylase [Thermoleophilia bacterium]